MSELRHAIIGCGRVAPNHADAFRRLPDVRLCYAVDPLPGRARAFADEHRIEHAVATLEEVLADPGIGSISLCTPHHLHMPQAMAALAAGKHVLVEKPFVIRPEDAAALAARAVERGLVVMPVAQHRFDPLVASVGAMVAEGTLGHLALVRGHLECLRPSDYYRDSDWRGRWDREGGSVLINQAYHIVELIRWLAGPVHGVSAWMNTLRDRDGMETEDTLVASLAFANGALGALTVTGAGGSQWRSFIELIGTGGEVAFDINHPNVLHRFQLADKRAMRQWRQRFAESEAASGGAVGIDYYGVTHRQQAAAFVALIRGEAEIAAAPVGHAQAVVELIDRIYTAARGRGVA